MSKWDRVIGQICEGVKPTMRSKNDYIKREDAERLLRYDFLSALTEDERVDELNRVPSADVVEVGIITCFGIKFVMEDDMIKVKWRHGDKHYLVPFGGLLELWEKYEEQEHE